MKRTLTATVQGDDRESIAEALEAMAADIRDKPTVVGQKGLAGERGVYRSWHLDEPNVKECATIEELVVAGLIDGDEYDVLKNVNPDTVAQACREGHYAVRHLVMLHYALSNQSRKGKKPDKPADSNRKIVWAIATMARDAVNKYRETGLQSDCDELDRITKMLNLPEEHMFEAMEAHLGYKIPRGEHT